MDAYQKIIALVEKKGKYSLDTLQYETISSYKISNSYFVEIVNSLCESGRIIRDNNFVYSLYEYSRHASTAKIIDDNGTEFNIWSPGVEVRQPIFIRGNAEVYVLNPNNYIFQLRVDLPFVLDLKLDHGYEIFFEGKKYLLIQSEIDTSSHLFSYPNVVNNKNQFSRIILQGYFNHDLVGDLDHKSSGTISKGTFTKLLFGIFQKISKGTDNYNFYSEIEGGFDVGYRVNFIDKVSGLLCKDFEYNVLWTGDIQTINTFGNTESIRHDQLVSYLSEPNTKKSDDEFNNRYKNFGSFGKPLVLTEGDSDPILIKAAYLKQLGVNFDSGNFEGLFEQNANFMVEGYNLSNLPNKSFGGASQLAYGISNCLLDKIVIALFDRDAAGFQSFNEAFNKGSVDIEKIGNDVKLKRFSGNKIHIAMLMPIPEHRENNPDRQDGAVEIEYYLKDLDIERVF